MIGDLAFGRVIKPGNPRALHRAVARRNGRPNRDAETEWCGACPLNIDAQSLDLGSELGIRRIAG
jgi:hypothetical protein